jgi:hypothetical protein
MQGLGLSFIMQAAYENDENLVSRCRVWEATGHQSTASRWCPHLLKRRSTGKALLVEVKSCRFWRCAESTVQNGRKPIRVAYSVYSTFS